MCPQHVESSPGTKPFTLGCDHGELRSKISLLNPYKPRVQLHRARSTNSCEVGIFTGLDKANGIKTSKTCASSRVVV